MCIFLKSMGNQTVDPSHSMEKKLFVY